MDNIKSQGPCSQVSVGGQIVYARKQTEGDGNGVNMQEDILVDRVGCLFCR